MTQHSTLLHIKNDLARVADMCTKLVTLLAAQTDAFFIFIVCVCMYACEEVKG